MKYIGLLLLTALLTMCATGQGIQLTDKALQVKYQSAVKDAEIAEKSEISDKLTAISKKNKRLSWQKNKVLTVTWTNWDGYDKQIGKTMTLSREVWVTAAPDLQEFCRKDRSELLTLRLEQLLGLPPKNGKTKFVEIYAENKDIFRPTPDAEIDDTVAELKYPAKTSKEHKKWMEDLRKKSYGPNGYPWTRLGYSYDWGNPKSEVGLSEFVIRAGAKVKIASVQTTKDYCRK